MTPFRFFEKFVFDLYAYVLVFLACVDFGLLGLRLKELMKTNDIKKTIVALAVAAICVANSNALPEAQVAALKKTFKGVPATEMAAKAADVVSNTAVKERTSVAVEVVKIVVAKKPAVAASAVAAIAMIAPETASAVAAAAASLTKENAENIALAAAKAAPQYSASVFQSVSQAVPSLAPKFAQFQAPATTAGTAETTTVSSTATAAAGVVIVPGHISIPTDANPPNYAGDATGGYDNSRPVVPPYSSP
jgi:hypothetical protein